MKKKTQWCYMDPDGMYGGPYPTKPAAIKAAREAGATQVGQTHYIVPALYSDDLVQAETILELMDEQVTNDYYFQDEVFKISEKDLTRAQRALNKAVAQWVKRWVRTGCWVLKKNTEETIPNAPSTTV